MGECTRKCSNGCGEVAVMEIAQGVDNSGSAKRRKVVGNGELRLSSSKAVRITGEEDVITTSKKVEDVSNPCGVATSFSSGDVPASCCSSSGSITDKMKCTDLEERAEIETTMRKRNNSDRRESTPTSELKEESGELESSKPPVLIDSRREIPADRKPPAAEIEEFFAAAEKDLQNRFKDKYNYDIVKDVPLKGRFEWVQLKP